MGPRLGPHWYYDLKEQHRDYGTWINDYTEPKPGRYHAGRKAGELSQQRYLILMMARSIVASGGYNHTDFCCRLDEDLFPQLDGSPLKGPGGYTSQSIRDAWKRRVEQGQPWDRVAGHTDTTEALERVLPLAIHYAKTPSEMAIHVITNTALTQSDHAVQAMTLAFAAVLGLLGAQVGLDRLPERFVAGLIQREEILDLARSLDR